MDIESLKLIISTLNDLGANSKEAFVYYLIASYGSVYLFGIIWSCITIYIVKLSYRLLNNSSDLSKLRDASKINYYFSKEELNKACKVLEKYYNEKL